MLQFILPYKIYTRIRGHKTPTIALILHTVSYHTSIWSPQMSENLPCLHKIIIARFGHVVGMLQFVLPYKIDTRIRGHKTPTVALILRTVGYHTSVWSSKMSQNLPFFHGTIISRFGHVVGMLQFVLPYKVDTLIRGDKTPTVALILRTVSYHTSVWSPQM